MHVHRFHPRSHRPSGFSSAMTWGTTTNWCRQIKMTSCFSPSEGDALTRCLRRDATAPLNHEMSIEDPTASFTSSKTMGLVEISGLHKQMGTCIMEELSVWPVLPRIMHTEKSLQHIGSLNWHLSEQNAGFTPPKYQTLTSPMANIHRNKPALRPNHHTRALVGDEFDLSSSKWWYRSW